MKLDKADGIPNVEYIVDFPRLNKHPSGARTSVVVTKSEDKWFVYVVTYTDQISDELQYQLIRSQPVYILSDLKSVKEKVLNWGNYKA